MTNLRRSCLLVVISCGPTTPIGQPAGDNNYDDPDQPGQEGISTGSDAAVDANGTPCVAARDCPAAFLCSYALSGDATTCGLKGVCLPYAPPAICEAGVACGCDNSEVLLCAPAGYAPAPIQSLGACDGGAANDAGSDAASD